MIYDYQEYIAMQTAKTFMTGRSQAVRLPAEFRFDTDEVYIRRDPVTGDGVLSRRPCDWREFFAVADGAVYPAGWMAEFGSSTATEPPSSALGATAPVAP